MAVVMIGVLGGFVVLSLPGMSSLTNGSGIHVMTFQTADVAHG